METSGCPPTCIRIHDITPEQLQVILYDLGQEKWTKALATGKVVDKDSRLNCLFPLGFYSIDSQKKEVRIAFVEPTVCTICAEFGYKSSKTPISLSGYSRRIFAEQGELQELADACKAQGRQVDWLTNEPPPPRDPSETGTLERILNTMFGNVGPS